MLFVELGQAPKSDSWEASGFEEPEVMLYHPNGKSIPKLGGMELSYSESQVLGGHTFQQHLWNKESQWGWRIGLRVTRHPTVRTKFSCNEHQASGYHSAS